MEGGSAWVGHGRHGSGRKPSGQRRRRAARLFASRAGGAERTPPMRRFLTGLLLGMASMYWYAYQKDAFMDQVKVWFAEASHDAGAPKKVDALFSRRK